jgi:hypothetical protein
MRVKAAITRELNKSNTYALSSRTVMKTLRHGNVLLEPIHYVVTTLSLKRFYSPPKQLTG